MTLDFFCRLFQIAWSEGNQGCGEVCTVDRIVDRDGDFELGVVIDRNSSNSSPHRLQQRCHKIGIEMSIVQTVRLANAVVTFGFCFVPIVEERRRLTAAEALDSN